MNELLRHYYGIVNLPPNTWEQYGFALLCIAGSDGKVAPEEMDWLINDYGREAGVPEATIQAWKNFDYKSHRLTDVVQDIVISLTANYSKMLIYDAIRMASADNHYALKEREAVSDAAKILKLDKDTILSIEALVEMESAIEKIRMTIF